MPCGGFEHAGASHADSGRASVLVEMPLALDMSEAPARRWHVRDDVVMVDVAERAAHVAIVERGDELPIADSRRSERVHSGSRTEAIRGERRQRRAEAV